MDGDDHGIAAHLLLIEGGSDLMSQQLRRAFPEPMHRVQVARAGYIELEQLFADSPDIVVLDMGLPDQFGLEVLKQIRQIDARIPVIFITLAKAADAAIEAMKQGAYDYLFKPLDLHHLQRVVGEALEVAWRIREPGIITEYPMDEGSTCAIVGTCPAMREVYKEVGRGAAQDVPVLITGESGTGKEVVARAIYQHSRRATKPFLALNCAAIPETLLESELFGHEKGAFTGADRRRIGRFEQCNGGTLFLDEIGDMPLTLQAKLLRVLQEQTFERVGGAETVTTDVRIISATHRDLVARVSEGTFRADLFYRLAVFNIHLPPLRDRGDDLPLLVRYYLQRFARELGRDVRGKSGGDGQAAGVLLAGQPSGTPERVEAGFDAGGWRGASARHAPISLHKDTGRPSIPRPDCGAGRVHQPALGCGIGSVARRSPS